MRIFARQAKHVELKDDEEFDETSMFSDGLATTKVPTRKNTGKHSLFLHQYVTVWLLTLTTHSSGFIVCNNNKRSFLSIHPD